MTKRGVATTTAKLDLILTKLASHDLEFGKISHKLADHDLEFGKISHKFDEVIAQNRAIHEKIDAIAQVINGHYLKQGIQIEKLEKIHPDYAHATL